MHCEVRLGGTRGVPQRQRSRVGKPFRTTREMVVDRKQERESTRRRRREKKGQTEGGNTSVWSVGLRWTVGLRERLHEKIEGKKKREKYLFEMLM